MAPQDTENSSQVSSLLDLSKPPIPGTNLEKTVEDEIPTKDESERSANAGLTDELSHIDTSDYPSALPLAMIIIALVLSIFLVALDMTIVATAIPKITDQFHSLNQVGWYGSAFFLTLGAFQSTWGKVYKYFPLKISFLLSIFLFEIGSLICAVCNDSTTLIIGRAIAGLGGAGIASGVYTIVAFSAPPAQRPAFTGIMGATFGIASVIGPLLGGVFTDGPGWRWCFYINLPIGGVGSIIIFLFFIPPKAARPQNASMKEKILQMDFPGTFILMAALVCYLLAMQWGGTTKPWNSADVIGVLIGFGLLLIVFIVIEFLQGDRALLQGRLLKDRTFAAMAAFIFFIAGVFFIQLYYLPIYFQATKNVSAAKSGIDNLPLVLGASIFSVVSGMLITVFGQYLPIMAVGSVLSCIGCGLLYTLEIDSHSNKWIGYQSILGIGVGLVFQVPVIVAQANVKPSDLSSASAMMLFFQTIGGATWISAGQAGFVNRMLERAVDTVPGVNKLLLVATGATDLRRVFSASEIPGILDAYIDGIKVTWIISLVSACITAVLVLAPRYENIKGKIPTTGAA